MNRDQNKSKSKDDKTRTLTTPLPPIDSRLVQYPTDQREYERMMRHDSYRKVRGAIRQTRWGEHDQ